MMHTAHNPDTRVLIVEDNVITSQELSRQLMELGYTRIESAFSGLEAVEKAEQVHPDLVLMDIHLGVGIDGTEAAERIWRSLRIPIVYLTAYTDSETLRKAHVSEPFGYVLKPFDERTLYVAIETALAKHKADALLEAQKNLLDDVFKHVQEGIALVNEFGTIQFCNAGYAAIVGEPLPENLVGERIFRFFDQESITILVAEMKQRLQGHSSTYELPLVSIRDQARWVRISVVPRFDSDQRWIGEFVTMLDITDRKQMEQDLERAKDRAEKAFQEAESARNMAESANQAKGEFLARLSHELRTPLNAILGYAQLIQRHNSLNRQSHNAVDTILRSGEHLLTMIGAVLDFSKTEARKIELEEKPISLSGLLKQVFDIVQVQGCEKQIQFTCRIDPDLPAWIRGDETRLRQVLLNLLQNAVKFTDRGRVSFKATDITADMLQSAHSSKARPAGPHLKPSPDEAGRTRRAVIRYEVEDTGIGIPLDMQERIFLPFIQVHPRHAALKGTGLGLPICQNLLQMMGSTLSVESQPEWGSRFWFDLTVQVAEDGSREPATAAESAGTTEKTIVGFRGRPVSMLIVDDHKMNRAVIRDMIGSLGFTILEAGNGFDGLEKARIFSPDVILMDLMMPTLDGFETTRRLREQPQASDTLIIGISASLAEEIRNHSLEAGCTAFLSKPLKLNALLDLLQQHLQLEWLYDQKTGPTSTRNRHEPLRSMTIIPPSPERLSALFELARSGDIAGLRALLPDIADEGPTLIPFVDHLHGLSKGFHMNEIKAFLERYMTTSSHVKNP